MCICVKKRRRKGKGNFNQAVRVLSISFIPSTFSWIASNQARVWTSLLTCLVLELTSQVRSRVTGKSASVVVVWVRFIPLWLTHGKLHWLHSFLILSLPRKIMVYTQVQNCSHAQSKVVPAKSVRNWGNIRPTTCPHLRPEPPRINRVSTIFVSLCRYLFYYCKLIIKSLLFESLISDFAYVLSFTIVFVTYLLLKYWL